ncbi:50S ribosomal protein L13 [Candidatus Woesearchaeota archaeon]|nr:50S ribosomal protein L13 [Candidatus Woesearchaeota archaeon]
MIIDGKNQILGRLASFAAKQALLGKKVNVINCEDVIISGRKNIVFEKYKKIDDMGIQPRKGPFQPKMPDRFVRKVIKRMLPIDRTRGLDAFHNVMCYIGTPDEFKNMEITNVNANASKLSTLNMVRVGEICKELGGKKW